MADQWNDGDAEALGRLCTHFGIAPHYHDIWGTRHPVARSNLVRLLAEFGVNAGEAESPSALLDSCHRADWVRALPPVVAITASTAGWSITVRLPAALPKVRWLLTEEDGVVHEGEIDLHAVAEVARIDRDGTPWSARQVALPIDLPAGYHRLRLAGHAGETLVISAPERCYRPPALARGERIWGPAVQLYSLRSPRNWGIGDFTDLAQLVVQVAARGAHIVGLNPLHAMFTHNPAHASPYSPSSRRQLNVLYIDVEAVTEFQTSEPAQRVVRSPAFQSRLAGLREGALVDYPGVAAAKFEVLELLHDDFVQRHLAADGRSARTARGQAFLDFVAERGDALQLHALFEALQAHLHAEDPAVWGWPAWPEAYRDPEGEAARAFAASHAQRVRYHCYLQWLAAEQLARAGEACRALGLAVGLFLDLAVSVDRAGSDVWGERASFAAGASVGAPPDEFNPAGQNWGLPPLRPDALRTTGYRVFIDTLRANMHGAGALRIDHVMGLMRLFWIPEGGTAHDGAYVHYALDEMLAIVALESQRHRCMVIGEDLGTVADEMRAALSRSDVLSYRLMYFERGEHHDFKPAADYPAAALVAVSTHDLATLAGWWSSHDLRLRLQLGLFPAIEVFEKQLLDRAAERVRLLLAVQRTGLLTSDQVADATARETLPPDAVIAIHAFLAAAPSTLMLVQMEDVAGAVEQVNMPGTTDAQPNWRRKLPIDLQALGASAHWQALAERLRAERPGTTAARQARDAQPRIPRATYRLQFHKDFGFDDAIRTLPYLARLGVSHVYCSPIQRARAGSMHGYDVVAHDEINPELGGAEGFARFVAALADNGLGQLLDMVPNHMGVLGADNAWWMDVLENGAASLYAQHFDIDWQPLNPELTGKVLLPVLGGHYGDVLDNGELALHFEAASGSLALQYFDHRFPLAPESYPQVLQPAAARLDDLDLTAALGSIATAFGNLPSRDAAADALDTSSARADRARDKDLLQSRLARLAARQPAVLQAILAAVAELQLASARDALHALIEVQAYRLAYWRVAADDINYRRFFDINELAALRMERPEVFEATQSFALDLAAAGVVDGLRIDHPDGMHDPAAYFRDLQVGYARRTGLTLPEQDADGRPARPLYVVAEKIAAGHEEVPESWHIHGTTGYRFANVANGVLVDTAAAGRFDTLWRNFTGQQQGFAALSRIGKHDVIRSALASELTVLSTQLVRIARADRRTRDYTLNAVRRALAEVAACMPVYRTYFIDSASEQDVHFVDAAVKAAESHSRDADLSIFAFLRQALLGEAVPGAPDALRERVRRFAIRFQQFSAPVAAKGVEDTAFYRYFPLSSLNEVGGEPDVFGMTVAQFHAASADRAARWPHTMLATSTHDNKRSEDVRNRIDVLSEMPATWRFALRRWRQLNRGIRDALEAGGAPAGMPSAADEYLLYQTLLGTLPPGGLDAASREAYADRIVRYMQKAARESKVHTRWTHPDAGYEDALEGFIRALLGTIEDNPCLTDIQWLARSLAHFGAWNSLTLMLLKYTSPGVPDLYQGNELMDLSLVDPDNRRPVDYTARAARLAALEAMAATHGLPVQVAELVRAPHEGDAKLWFIWRLLSLRREDRALFDDGSYEGLVVEGDRSGHALAFARRHGDDALVVIAGRLFVGLCGTDGLGDAVLPALPGADHWADTRVLLPGLPNGTRLRDALTGAVCTVEDGGLRLSKALAAMPWAALRVLSAGDSP
ncbi:MAG: malto-oligosyltrehalose synthase [Variovorax sp.]|nr:MAG: malto-oligosyltrehalose synthase [Variovorax sp.]